MSDKLERDKGKDQDEPKKKRGNDALFRTMTADEWERLQTILDKHDANSGDDLDAPEKEASTNEKAADNAASAHELPTEGVAQAIAASAAHSQVSQASASAVAATPYSQSSHEFSNASSNAPTQLRAGGILKGSYRLIKSLSVGKLGTVYAVDHVRFGGRYAVKVLHPHLAQAPQQLQHILRAIRGAERLNHGGFVRPFLLDQDEATHAIFYFMDFVAGHSLSQALSKRTGQEDSPPFSAQSLLDFMTALIEPLRYAHKRDMICRNLHPAHVIKTNDEQTPVRLLNFGFPIQVAQTAGQSMTSDALSDLYYAAPELRTPGQPVTAATDVFSLGVILYQMLTGILPVGVAQPPSRIFGVWPPAVDAVVGKATQANWQERYQSVDAFAEGLNRALRGQTNDVAPSMPSARSIDAAPSSINRFRSVVSPAAVGPRHNPSREEIPRVQPRRTRQPSFEETRAVGRMPSMHPPGGPMGPPGRPTGMPHGRMPSMHPAGPPGGHGPVGPTGRMPSMHPPGGPMHPHGRPGGIPGRPGGRPPVKHTTGERPQTQRGRYMPTTPGSQLAAPAVPQSSASMSTEALAIPELRGLPPSKPATAFQAHEQTITSVKLSPDGKFLATAGQDNTFKIWSAGTWSLLHNVEVPAFRISHLQWSHNSRYIAFANDEDQIEVWDLQNQQRVHLFSPQARVISIAWNPNGHHLYAATDDGHISIWHLALGRQAGRLLGHKDAVNALLYVPGQDWLISGGEDPTIRLWNVSNKQLQKAVCQSKDPTYAMALSPQGDRLVTGHSDGSIHLYSFPQGQHQAILQGHEGTIRSLSIAPKNTWLASASHDSHIILWDTTQHTMIADLTHHNSPVHSIDIHHTGRWMVSASNDTELCIWDVSRL